MDSYRWLINYVEVTGNASLRHCVRLTEVTLNCADITIGVPSIVEQTVLVPYDAGLRENNATFRLLYQYLLCSDFEEVNITGIISIISDFFSRWNI